MAFSSDRSGVMPPDLAVDEVVMIVDSQLPRAMWLVRENLKIVSLGGWYSVVSGRASKRSHLHTTKLVTLPQMQDGKTL